MTPSLGSRRAGKRPTGLPSRSGGEKGDGSRDGIDLWSRVAAPATTACASRPRSRWSRGRRRHFAGTGAGATALLQSVLLRTHSKSRMECDGESRLRLGVSVCRGPREMARRGTCKRTAGPAAMMAPASLRPVNLLRLVLDGPLCAGGRVSAYRRPTGAEDRSSAHPWSATWSRRTDRFTASVHTISIVWHPGAFSSLSSRSRSIPRASAPLKEPDRSAARSAAAR